MFNAAEASGTADNEDGEGSLDVSVIYLLWLVLLDTDKNMNMQYSFHFLDRVCIQKILRKMKSNSDHLH